MKTGGIVMFVVVMACALPSARAAGPGAAPAARPPAVVELLEENAEALLPQLTNPTRDPGEGYVERHEIFSGVSGVKIVPMQRFHPNIPGWNYRIVEKPAAAGEFRFVRFAWKSDEFCCGTMIQFHIETGWSVRYCAGQNLPGWGCKFVAPGPPVRWVVVTRDLFADFGECTVTGMALAAFGNGPAYFDHIYFGRTVEDLDRIDVTGVHAEGPVRLEPAEMGRLWTDLCGDHAPKAYVAFWTLIADPERAAPFLKEKAGGLPLAGDLPALVRRWIIELDAASPAVRAAASEQLARHLDVAGDLLRDEAANSPSPEARLRAAQILRERDRRGPWPDPAREAVRTLRMMGTPDARKVLEDLAKGADGAPATAAAREAIKTL